MLLRLPLLSGLLGITVVSMISCAGTPTAVPTATPSPTMSPLPTPTPETSVGSSQSLPDTAMAYLAELAEGVGPRASATAEELKAAEYLATQFADLGYSVETQSFPVERLSLDQSGLSLDQGGNTERLEIAPLSGSSFGKASGALVPVGLGRMEDIPEEGLEGKMALVERGIITFERKARNAREAGAIGLVIYNNGDGNFRGDLGYPADIPVVSISRSDGQGLEALLAGGEVAATIVLDFEEFPSRNVIAERPGTGGGVVVIGAHYDTVPNVPGASDNASGTAVVLAIAEALANKPLPFTVRFIAFGSEELGLLGSRAYVDSLSAGEREQIIAMLNFDALGSGSSLGVLGDLRLTDLVAEQGRLQGVAVEVSPGLQGGSSDHAPFARMGVPVVMFFSNDTSRIHTPQDTLESINPDLPGGAARLGLALLDALAESS